MANITYKKATIEDTKILVDNRILFALELGGEQNQEDINSLGEYMANYFLKATSNNSCISIIAKCTDAVAGIGSMVIKELPGGFKNPSGKWEYIMNMYTIPSYRRRGICKEILNLLVEEGMKYGVSAFELHATNEGEFVYRQNGFNIHDEPTYRKFIAK